MPIYIFFEGRRYWPVWALKIFHQMERQRLASLHRTMRACETKQKLNETRFQRTIAGRHYLEAAVEISSFPLNTNRLMPEVTWPTRLGNLIAAFEQYPSIKYGLDAVFFWPRIWVAIDQPLRDEIDNQQAQADGLLYSVVALILSSATFAAYRVFHLDWPADSTFKMGSVDDLAASIVCIVLAFVVYRFSLHAHRQFGELFKAMFDQYRDKIALEENVKLVANLAGDPQLVGEIDYMKNVAVWRFLRWHRVRLRGESTNRRVRTR